MKRLIAVGIITYDPDIEAVVELVDRLQGDSVRLYVIDNGSENIDRLTAEVSACANVELIPNASNMGVATAINQLVDLAKSLGCSCIMPVDQDSKVDFEYAEKMLARFSELNQAQKNIGALGAKVYDVRTGSDVPFKQFDFPWQQHSFATAKLPSHYHSADFLISSGTLLSLDCLAAVGGMNEKFFIDSVDMEWCFRASAQGWILVGCEDEIIQQEIGDDDVRVPLLGFKLRIHESRRYYYMTRNRIFLYGQSYVKWGWRLRDVRTMLLKFFALLIISPHRADIARQHYRGLVDSFKL